MAMQFFAGDKRIGAWNKWFFNVGLIAGKSAR